VNAARDHGLGHLLRAGELGAFDLQAGLLEDAALKCGIQRQARRDRPIADQDLVVGAK
jgi:hypothetical protein